MISASGAKAASRRCAAACIALAIAAAAACSTPQAAASRNGAPGELRGADGRHRGPLDELIASLAENGYQEYIDDIRACTCNSVNCALYEYGGTILHEAVSSSDTALIALCIRHGADIEARDREGWTPLMYAADSCCPESARLLLGKGAQPGAVNDDGQRAVDIAKENGCAELEKLLDER